MSIENTLERIMIALEKIADKYTESQNEQSMAMPAPAAPEAPKRTRSPKKAEVVIPPMNVPPVMTSMTLDVDPVPSVLRPVPEQFELPLPSKIAEVKEVAKPTAQPVILKDTVRELCKPWVESDEKKSVERRRLFMKEMEKLGGAGTNLNTLKPEHVDPLYAAMAKLIKEGN